MTFFVIKEYRNINVSTIFILIALVVPPYSWYKTYDYIFKHIYMIKAISIIGILYMMLSFKLLTEFFVFYLDFDIAYFYIFTVFLWFFVPVLYLGIYIVKHAHKILVFIRNKKYSVSKNSKHKIF